MVSTIFVNGMDLDGNPLIPPFEEKTLSQKLKESLIRNPPELLQATRRGGIPKSFRTIRPRGIDIADPKKVGWTFLVNSQTPNLEEIIEIINPLAIHRNMNSPTEPFFFNVESEDEWLTWLEENYHSLILEDKKVPYYILLVGGPDLIPFDFQSLLDTFASVGRICFDSNDELETYVNKIIRLETEESNLQKKALVFAPDEGLSDATYFSRNYMAEPLAEHIDNLGFQTVKKFGTEAIKQNLKSELENSNPAFVYTASHGVGAMDKELDYQKRINGSIFCQKELGVSRKDTLYTAEDLPDPDVPFLEGSIFFQFACFGYGTPAESYFAHWDDDLELDMPGEGFVSALPKKLLAHPKGPIAYVGHLDIALLHGFNDPNNPYINEKWHKRIAPFVKVINTLLDDFNPIGPGMGDLNTRLNLTNDMLSNYMNRLKKNEGQDLSNFFKKIADLFITRSDAKNYMVFGDPAARLHIKSDFVPK